MTHDLHLRFNFIHPRLASVVAGATLALAASGALAQPSTASIGQDAAGSDQLHKVMTDGMAGMQQMKPSGDIDKDFAMMMKMHHQQAVDMAKPEIENGKSPRLKAMARKIVKDQTKEIQQLDAWMAKHP